MLSLRIGKSFSMGVFPDGMFIQSFNRSVVQVFEPKAGGISVDVRRIAEAFRSFFESGMSFTYRGDVVPPSSLELGSLGSFWGPLLLFYMIFGDFFKAIYA